MPCVLRTLLRHVPHVPHAECALVLHLPSTLGVLLPFLPNLLQVPHVQHTLVISCLVAFISYASCAFGFLAI